MSRATKISIMLIGLALIFVVSTGSRANHIRSPKVEQHLGWLASIGGRFDIQPREVSTTDLQADAPMSSNISSEEPNSPQIPEPVTVKGVYLTAWIAGKSDSFRQLINFMNKSEVNSVVIDVKDDTGTISYPSQVSLSQAIGSGSKKFDPTKIMLLLKQNNIYPIARIVVFKDPYLAKHRPDLAVKNSQGRLWRDFKGLNWVDPYNKEVWNYNVEIAKEAIEYGFREIQFDYIRFTSDGNIRDCRYPKEDGRIKADVIRDFLKYAYQELKPLGVKVSADVFGMTCSADGDIGIGQVIQKVAEGVDIVCPMVYPSHYVKGVYKIPNPDVRPYDTVYKSLSDAQKKLETANRKVVIRAWLQDFSLKSHYGRAQLLAQIKAVEKAGLKEWIFWNPSSRYDLHKYRLKTEVPVETPVPSDNEAGDNDVQYPNSQLDQIIIP